MSTSLKLFKIPTEFADLVDFYKNWTVMEQM